MGGIGKGELYKFAFAFTASLFWLVEVFKHFFY